MLYPAELRARRLSIADRFAFLKSKQRRLTGFSMKRAGPNVEEIVEGMNQLEPF